MTAVRAVGRMVGRLLRALGGAIGRAIRDLAEPAAIGNTFGANADHTIDAVGGSMMAGAGRRAGDAANKGTGPDEPDEPDY